MSKTLFRRLSALFMVFAVTLSMMPALTVTANAASKKKSNKIQLVMQEKDYEGNSVKYKYNKKGLVAKKTSKYTTKGETSDFVTTETTTYKYNKKNRIAIETLKVVQNEKYYDTNKTTGKNNGKVLGNVTTTTTRVTKYIYNKKGAATKSVTTETEAKSGSITETSQSLMIEDDGAIQVGDKYLAGYNYRNPDGSYIEDETSKNAYYYTGAITEAVDSHTITTTYKDNGNGTYTVITEDTRKPANYNTKNNTKYYKYNEEDKVVPATEDDSDFEIVESVTVELDSSGSRETVSKEERTVKAESTVTRVYKNDKKKRAVKATVTGQTKTSEAINTTETTNRKYSDDDDYYYDKDYNEVYSKSTTTVNETEKSSSTVENTDNFSYVETYKYDKKGHRKQTVYDNKGIEDSRMLTTEGPASYASNKVINYADGKSETFTEENSYDGDGTTEAVISGGTKKVTVTKVPYSATYKDTTARANGEESSSSTKETITPFADGSVKTVSDGTSTRKNVDGETTTTVFDSVKYMYGEDGNKYSYVENEKTTYSDGSKYEDVNSEYSDGNETHYGYAVDDDYDTEEEKAEKAKLRAEVDALNKATEAKGANYVDTTTGKADASPIKTITKCKYDKSGNLKSATTTKNWIVIESLINETYGNPVYQYDAEGRVEEVEVQVSHKSTTNKSKENTLKKGSTRASSSTSVSKMSEDRSTPSYSTGERVTYKLKGKKINKKLQKDVELQQWMIQNPECGGVIGL